MGAVLKGCSLVIEVDWLELEIEVRVNRCDGCCLKGWDGSIGVYG